MNDRLITRASDDEHQKVLQQVCDCGDSRAIRAKRLYKSAIS